MNEDILFADDSFSFVLYPPPFLSLSLSSMSLSQFGFDEYFCWIFVKRSLSMHFSLLMASVAYHLLSECWMPWIDSGVDEAGFHLMICPQLSENSLGSLIEIKDCHLPHTSLVPGRKPELFSPGKRISYISFKMPRFCSQVQLSIKRAFIARRLHHREMMLSRMEYKENHIPNSLW